MNDHPNATPNPEVHPHPKRRRFTKQYKMEVLEKADACTQAGEIEALLRREGLYSSHLANWRKLRKKGQLGRDATNRTSPGKKQHDKLAAENEQLRKQLEQAQAIIQVQKKLCDLLGLPQETDIRKPSS